MRVTCPGCAQDVEPTPVGFTWWGGVVGPRLLDHVQCPGCGRRFNGKTGQSNALAIRIYVAMVVILTVAVGYLVFTELRS